jgi:hypothetical protein
MAQSFRNRSALSGYIARQVKTFFAWQAKKLGIAEAGPPGTSQGTAVRTHAACCRVLACFYILS